MANIKNFKRVNVEITDPTDRFVDDERITGVAVTYSSEEKK